MRRFFAFSAVLSSLLVFLAGARGQVLVLGAQASNEPGFSYHTPVLQELSPPQRPGRPGGVYVTGADPPPSTNNLSRTLSQIKNWAATTNSGSSNGAVATVAGTNDEATTIINLLDEGALPAGVLYPAVLPAPAPPGNQRAGNRGAVRDTPESVLGGGTPSLAPGPFTPPSGPTVPATGTIGVPPGPAEIPPSPPPTGTTLNSTSVPGVPPPIVSPPSPTGRSR